MGYLKKLFNWYFSKKSLPYWCIILLDCIIVFVSGVFIYYLSHRGMQTVADFKKLTHTLLSFIVLSLLGFRIFHTYSGIVRYSSFVDLTRVMASNLLSAILAIGLYYIAPSIKGFVFYPPRMIVGMFAVSASIMCAMRVLVKMLYETDDSDFHSISVLIYGAMSGGVGLAKSIRSQRPRRYNLCGFISHDKHYRNSELMGQKVYTINDDLRSVIAKKHIEGILVSPLRTEDFRNEQDLQNMFIDAGVKIYIAQTEHEWDGTEKSLESVQLHEVSVEELLPRQKIEVDMQAIGRQLEGKRILITGAAGSIGSEMVRQVANFLPSEMVLIDMAETPMHDIRLMMANDFSTIRCHTIVTSICREDRMEQIFSQYRPEYVFHAAAYKHVPMMEDNPKEAVQNNIYGTRVIADLAVKYGTAKFVMISTDKAVNPTNVMGCSKRICEIYCQALNAHQDTTQFVTTRFGNVLGSNGSVIPLFREQIRKGGPVTVTHPEIIRYFMLIPEACKLVLEAGAIGHGGEIFVFDMGKPVKIADLAKRMIKLSGANNIEIKFTGLRDGEKLYEEVLSDKETTKPTDNPRIMVAAVREYPYDEILAQERELYELTNTADDMAIVKKMKEIVPEYKSRHSVYEVLDMQQRTDAMK